MHWQFVESRTAACWLLARDRDRRETAAPQSRLDSTSAVTLTESQARTARRARAALQRRGGVLIADRVGEGKTFIALRLIEEAIADGAARILVTGPAAIRTQWTGPLRAVARRTGARSCAPSAARPATAAVTWLSHTQLSLGRWPAWLDPCHLVVVDESHSFRNSRTRRYRSLAWLCRGARVILLSATPINNSIADLYHQLRLFLADNSLEDLGVPDLGEAVRAAARSAGPALQPPLDSAIRAVVVRQRRRAPAGSAGLSRPHRDPPIALRFESGPVARDALEKAIAAIQGLDLQSLDARSGTPTAGLLVRFALVKRLESSPAAFLASINSLRRFLDAFVEATAQGFALRPADHRALAANREADQLVLAPLALKPLHRGVDRKALIESARGDSALLRPLTVLFRDQSGSVDPKLEVLAGLVSGPLAGRKVLVFTEFRDTAVSLWTALRGSLPVGLIHGGGAWIGAGRAGRRETVLRFAPVANGTRPPAAAERIDVLISTDVLSEGFNLQDAADVVSYDLPWNPVRIIQRVGRIDRLGSPHRTVRCYNFVPEQGLELMLGLVDRLEAKLDAIRAGIGVRERVLGESPLRSAHGVAPSSRTPAAVRTTSTIRRIQASDPDLFEDLDRAEEGGPDEDEWIARLLRSAADGTVAPQTRAPIVSSLPAHIDRAGWLVAVETGMAVRWLLIRRTARGLRVREDRGAAIAALAAVLETDPALLSTDPREATDIAAAPSLAEAALDHLDRTQPLPAGRHGVRRRLVRALMRSLAAEPGGPGASLCARADAVVDRLRSGVRAGVEFELARILRECRPCAGPCRGTVLLSRLEAALAPVPDTAGAYRNAAVTEPSTTPAERPPDAVGGRAGRDRSIQPAGKTGRVLAVLRIRPVDPSRRAAHRPDRRDDS